MRGRGWVRYLLLVLLMLLGGCGVPLGSLPPTPTATPPAVQAPTRTLAPTPPPARTTVAQRTTTGTAATPTSSAATPTRPTAPTVATPRPVATPGQRGTPAAGGAVGGAWLATNPPTNWNTPGAAIPTAPAASYQAPGATTLPCKPEPLPLDSPLRVQLHDLGWTVFREDTVLGDLFVVWGLASYDGMCRPMQFQAFVFWQYQFVGTLSPTPMDSRTDGALNQLAFPAPQRLEAVYARYQPSDPLCCPTRSSRLTLTVDPDQLLLIPIAVTTSTPGAAATPTR